MSVNAFQLLTGPAFYYSYGQTPFLRGFPMSVPGNASMQLSGYLVRVWCRDGGPGLLYLHAMSSFVGRARRLCAVGATCWRG